MKILLVIDLQPSFAVEPFYNKIIDYINKNYTYYDKVIATRFLNTKDSLFVQNLNYLECMNKESLKFPYTELLGKHTYSITSGLCQKTLKGNDVYIVGCDTDACILASCFKLWDNNVSFKILKEYCYSSGGEQINEYALKIIERNFGNCII